MLVEQCVLTYRVQMKTESIQGGAYLEMWCGQRPDLIKLNLAVEGAGTAWIRDVEVLQTQLK